MDSSRVLGALRGKRFGARQAAKRFLQLFAKNILHLSKMVLQESRLGFSVRFSFLFFVQFPLGRFYSSRPSNRIGSEIVSG